MLGSRSHTELRIPLESYVISDNVSVHNAVSGHTVMLLQTTLGYVITLFVVNTVMLLQTTLGYVITLFVVNTVMLLQTTLGYVITLCVVNTVMLGNVIMCSNAVLYLHVTPCCM